MKFVTTVFCVLLIAGSASALHPPVEPPSQGSSSGSGSTVHITSTTPTPASTPEPSTVALALIGLIGGSTLRLIRGRR